MPPRQPRCEQCGYDLRGLETVKEPRCPECGLVFDPQTLGHWVLPWTKRHLIGKRKAYWKTLWMLLKNQKEIRADTAVPLVYDDARDFCRRSQWLVYLPVAIATCLLYCTLYFQFDHSARWTPRPITAPPGAHGLPILIDPVIVDWATPWAGLAGLLVLEWLGLTLMPFLIALTVHWVAANNLPQIERQRVVVLCVYGQFLNQVILSLVALVPISVLSALGTFERGRSSVPPMLYAFPVVVGIGWGVLYLCAKSRHHLGFYTKVAFSEAWAVFLTSTLVAYGMLALRMVVAAVSSLWL